MGLTTAFSERGGFVEMLGGQTYTIVSKTVPLGSYVINAKVQVKADVFTEDPRAECRLEAGGTTLDRADEILNSPDVGGDPAESETFPLQATVSNFGGDIEVKCAHDDDGDESVYATQAVITAIRVDAIR